MRLLRCSVIQGFWSRKRVRHAPQVTTGWAAMVVQEERYASVDRVGKVSSRIVIDRSPT